MSVGKGKTHAKSEISAIPIDGGLQQHRLLENNDYDGRIWLEIWAMVEREKETELLR